MAASFSASMLLAGLTMVTCCTYPQGFFCEASSKFSPVVTPEHLSCVSDIYIFHTGYIKLQQNQIIPVLFFQLGYFCSLWLVEVEFNAPLDTI